MSQINQFPGGTFASVVNDQMLPGYIDVRSSPYLADPTGSADASSAIAAAITAASNNGGGVVWLGSGTFKVGTQISLASNVSILGSAHHATTINNTCSGDLFRLDAIHGCRIGALTITADSVRSAGYAIRVIGGDTTVKLASFGI